MKLKEIKFIEKDSLETVELTKEDEDRIKLLKDSSRITLLYRGEKLALFQVCSKKGLRKRV